MNTHERDLVHAFLLSMLPPTKSERRGRNNELATIASALDKWFKRNMGFHIGLSALAERFEELSENGYTLRPFGEDYDPELKTYRVVPELGEYRGEQPYAKREAIYIYINIDPKRVVAIRRLSTTLPANTQQSKLKELELIQDELRSFLIRHLGH